MKFEVFLVSSIADMSRIDKLNRNVICENYTATEREGSKAYWISDKLYGHEHKSSVFIPSALFNANSKLCRIRAGAKCTDKVVQETL